MREGINTLLACRDIADGDCCGCINGYMADDGVWVFACNECEKVHFSGSNMSEENIAWFKGYPESLLKTTGT